MIHFLVILELIKVWWKHLLLFHVCSGALLLKVLKECYAYILSIVSMSLCPTFAISWFFVAVVVMFFSIPKVLPTAGRREDLSRGRQEYVQFSYNQFCYQMRVPVPDGPNKSKCLSLEQRNIFCRAKQGDQVACAQKTP